MREITKGVKSYVHKFASNEAVLANVENVARMLGDDTLSRREYEKHGHYSYMIFIKRWGSWNKAIEAAGLRPLSGRRIIRRRSKSVGAVLRARVFMRDNFKCVWCNRSAQTHDVVMHIDHILPFSRGGKTEFENLQTLCADCNLGKSDVVVASQEIV